MWEKITAAVGLVLAFIMAIFVGKTKAEKKQAEKEKQQAEELVKKEAEYKEEAHKIKEEIFKEAEVEKQTLNTGSDVDKFNAAINILRKH